LLYKNIFITFYVTSELVVDGEWMFIIWDHNGVIAKYFPCAFEGIYVLGCDKYAWKFIVRKHLWGISCLQHTWLLQHNMTIRKMSNNRNV
jgi:hypothetical protein